MPANREDGRAARLSLSTFAARVGLPMTPWQADSLALRTRQSVVVAPRQSGKSRSLATLAAWWAFRRPGQTVLVVSAGDEAAKRLLATVRGVVQHPLLAGSVVDESQSLITLSNGSSIRSVPASQRQVRGWSVDLLIVDEAAFVDDDLLLSAAIPTTAARPDARIMLVSSPWSDEGAFWRLAGLGDNPDDQTTRTFRWKLVDCSWISEEQVASARASMNPLRFAAEYEGEFTGSATRLFPRQLLLANVAPYRVNDGGAVVVGADWGRAYDLHGLVAVGLLEDYGQNEAPVLFVPVVETSRRLYAEQVSAVAALADRFDVASVVSETNGVGAAPTELLGERLRGRVRVEPVASSQRSKEEQYGRLVMLLSNNELVLPDDPELLRQLGGIAATPTPTGGLSIAADSPAVHDDLPDALAFACFAVAKLSAFGPSLSEAPPDVRWLTTSAGRKVPAAARARRGVVLGRGQGLTRFMTSAVGAAPALQVQAPQRPQLRRGGWF